jgi:hypothetical protein
MAAALAGALALGAAAPQAAHDPDWRKCKKCLPAFTQAFGYVKANYKNPQTKRVIGSMLGGYVFSGFAFLAEGNSPRELEDCVQYCAQAIKDEGFNRNWYLSMCMFFLTEVALRNGLTPQIQRALADGLKHAASQQEETGGWCHHREMWKENGYNKRGGGRDLGMVTAMIYGAFLEMKALGIEVPSAMFERAHKNLESLSDGAGVRYGTDNMVGDPGMARASYVLMALQGTGRATHPFYSKYLNGLEGRFKQVEAGVHGFAPLHYFSVGAAMHRAGPDAYRKFADAHLDRLIATQTADGVVPLKNEDDVASTAVFATLVLLQRDGAFQPLRRVLRASSKSNKDEWKHASDALARGELGKAYAHLENIQPGKDGEELVPEAQAKMKRIIDAAWHRFNDARTLELAGETADALKAYREIAKEFPTLPAGVESKARLEALRTEKK